MNQDIFLLNFRIPLHLKVQFEDTCSQLRTNMTAELNRMIRDFIKVSREDIGEPIQWLSRHQEDWDQK